MPHSPSSATGETMSRICWTPGFALALGLGLAGLSPSGQAGGDKTTAYKPILTEPAYTELTRRSTERIGKLAKDDKAELKDLRGEALILAGYTLSTKDGPAAAQLRASAVKLASDAGNKDKAAATRKMAIDFAAGKWHDA